jgi:hypothetical protein
MKQVMQVVALAFFLVTSDYVGASDCKMFITAKNDTGSPVVAAIFNDRDERVSVLPISARSEVKFLDLCASNYKVIFKDGNRYTETEPISIVYTVTTVGNSTSTNWTNGSARYFVTQGRSSGKPAAPQYRF